MHPIPMAAPNDLTEVVDDAISTATIDIVRLTDHVRDPAAGAIATFEACTRTGSSNGRRVVGLRLEGDRPVVEEQLAALCAAARVHRPELTRLAVSHRLGMVPVGKAIFFVAASAAHRSDAEDACRFVIDGRTRLPIQKVEVYEDGET